MKNKTEFQPFIEVLVDNHVNSPYLLGYYQVNRDDFTLKIINEETSYSIFRLNDEKYIELEEDIDVSCQGEIYWYFISREELIEKIKELCKLKFQCEYRIEEIQSLIKSNE